MNAIGILITAALLSSADPIADWDTFEKAVRDQRIAKSEAQKAFPALYGALTERAARHPFSATRKWVFPIAGYSLKDVGKGGFRPDIRYGSSPIKGYDFYDGNLHGGHPAYDIFIRDDNRDCRDDRTGKSVAVVASINLLVLSTDTTWKMKSDIRGGNYVWALDLPHNRLFYFAHLDSIAVHGGDFIAAGSPLGSVGRSGKNATAARSPTHLHMMVLTVDGDRLAPFDFWGLLGGEDGGRR